MRKHLIYLLSSALIAFSLLTVTTAFAENAFDGNDIVDTEDIGFRDKVFYEMQENRSEMVQELDRKDCLKLYEEYKNITDKVNY